jgi:putative transposase
MGHASRALVVDGWEVEGPGRHPALAEGGPSKAELAVGLVSQARRRGLQPAYVLFDSWYAAAQILNLLDGWGWQYVTRLKSNRKLDGGPLRSTWPHRYGQARGKLRGVEPSVLVVKDGRRYWGTNVLPLTPREVKAHYAHRQQIAETFRLLKQEFGWGNCSCQKQQAQRAHLHLGLYAPGLTQQTACARGQTMYDFRQSLFRQRIPQNPLAFQEFAEAA